MGQLRQCQHLLERGAQAGAQLKIEVATNVKGRLMGITCSRERRDSVERESFPPEHLMDSLLSLFAVTRDEGRYDIRLIRTHKVRADVARGGERLPGNGSKIGGPEL